MGVVKALEQFITVDFDYSVNFFNFLVSYLDLETLFFLRLLGFTLFKFLDCVLL